MVNKHNTARVASCWFIIYYRLVMHGNSNIKNLSLRVSFYPERERAFHVPLVAESSESHSTI